MKWIKSRIDYLNEAKIRELINARQAKHVENKWGARFLDYEEVDPTPNIKQGKWKLSEEDKHDVLSVFCDANIGNLFKLFNSFPDKFKEVISNSIDTSLLASDVARVFESFDIKSPTLDQMILIYNNVFRKLSVTDTMANSVIMKDEKGVPIKDSEGKMMKKEKVVGDLEFTKNLISINSFITDYNSLVDKCIDAKVKGWSKDDSISISLQGNRDLSNLISYYKDNSGNDYDVDIEIFNRDLYLSISHNPKDILNMSISKFYSSCQHLYGGGYNNKVLANVFDPNSIPAFLVFETPIKWNGEIISDHLPLSRMIIRNIESFDVNAEKQLFFDRAYPDRLHSKISEIVEKYSDNKHNYKSGSYLYTPDIDENDSLAEPYQDRLGITKARYIGKNTKTLYLNRVYDWSNIKISPSAKLKEIIIETPDIPENLSALDLNLDWIKFKFMSLSSLDSFSRIKMDSIAFDKCKFDSTLLKDLANKDIKKLQILSCDISGGIDVSMFDKLEELQIIYTLNSIDDIDLDSLNIKKLVLSGDIVTKDSKVKINKLKQRGVKVEIIGPVI